MKSIQMKIIVYFNIMILVICLTLGVLVYSKSFNALEHQTFEALSAMAIESANVIDGRIDRSLLHLETIANRNIIKGIWNDRAATWEEKREILVEEKGRGNFLFLAISDKNGNAITTAVKLMNNVRKFKL